MDRWNTRHPLSLDGGVRVSFCLAARQSTFAELDSTQARCWCFSELEEDQCLQGNPIPCCWTLSGLISGWCLAALSTSASPIHLFRARRKEKHDVHERSVLHGLHGLHVFAFAVPGKNGRR